MESVKEIISVLGFNSVDDMEINDSYRFSVGGFDDLVIEKVGDDRLSVAHVYTQRGDLMRDPEIVFKVTDSEWMPIEYQQDPGIYEYDPSGLLSVKEFSSQWSTNLENQGFVNAAREQT